MTAWLTALGWALLNAYWQFALLCALYFFLCRFILLSPAARFRLAFSLVLSGAAWFFYDLFNHAPASLIDQNEISAIHLSLPAAMNRFYSAVAMAYLLMLSFISIRQLNGYHCLQRQSAADRQQVISLELFMKKIAGCWGLSPHIRIFSSTGIRVPQTMGFSEARYFLPPGLTNAIEY